MSQDNAEAQTQKCKLLSDSVPDGCAVITAEGSKLDVPLQKRKEDAKKTLYSEQGLRPEYCVSWIKSLFMRFKSFILVRLSA